MNHWLESIDIWHGATLRQKDSIFFKWSPWGDKWPWGTYFDSDIQQKDLKIFT